MPKAKILSPQDLYRAIQDKAKSENKPVLPPGLINHGNTCFMNSVLQGLIATRYMDELFHSKDLPDIVQPSQGPHITAHRSPLLTNGHGIVGPPYEHEKTGGMPLGDVFVQTMQMAWDAHSQQTRSNLSPRNLLLALGKKYDQYLGYQQQDAHEFLRLLLDAMRMEEKDIIKKRQPPPEKPKKLKKRGRGLNPKERDPSLSRSSQPTLPSDSAASSSTKEVEEPLTSISDMLFGGTLASVLVCQTCKHVSHTYEDFNDLSLSIKPEDYARERKRDRIRGLAKRLRLSDNSGIGKGWWGSDVARSSSVPPSPSPAILTEEPPFTEMHDVRRRSMDVAPPGALSGDDPHPPEKPGVLRSSSNVGFIEPDKSERKDKHRDEDSWAKLGRRISVRVGMKERPGRSRGRKDKLSDVPTIATEDITSETTTVAASNSSKSLPAMDSAVGADVLQLPSVDTSSKSLPITIPHPGSSSTPTPSPTPRLGLGGNRSPMKNRSPKPPKPSLEETAYLSQILADIVPATANPFGMNMFKTSGGLSNSAANLLIKMGGLPGIEECLRLFTMVEVLDGENMVGCRRCWKISQGTYKAPPESDEGSSDSEESESGVAQPLPTGNRIETPSSPPLPSSRSSPSASTSLSSSVASLNPYDATYETPASSLPAEPQLSMTQIPQDLTTAKPSFGGGFEIPFISTTAPDNAELSTMPIPASGEGPHPATHKHPHNSPRTTESLLAPDTAHSRANGHHRQPCDGGDCLSDDPALESDTSVSTSGFSDVSPAASRLGSQEHLHEVKRVRRPKQVIMRAAYKRYLIETAPPILVIHLKRFQMISRSPILSFSSNGFKKIDDFVAFSEILDLAPFMTPRKDELRKTAEFGTGKEVTRKPCLYRLYAVVVHMGNMLGGHYIAYTALPDPKEPPLDPTGPTQSKADSPSNDLNHLTVQNSVRQWAFISDTTVRLASTNEVLKAKAYLCMYERV